MVSPDVLYKYMPPKTGLKVLTDKKIRFTQPCFLNDPFEFRPGFPAISDEALGHFERRIAAERDTVYLEKSRLYGVLSLTEKRDSIPMWAHYSDSQKGFAIGFDTGSDLFRDAIEQGKLQRVQYTLERVNLTRGLGDQSHVHPDKIFLTKSKDWVYEKEWRWIESGCPFDYAEVELLKETGELLFLRPLPSNSILEVILGYRANRGLIESIQALISCADYKHVKLFKVVLDTSHYKLKVEPL